MAFGPQRAQQHRHEFSAAAGELYPDVTCVDGTGLLCRSAWLPDALIGLDQLRLGWVDNPPVPLATASSAASLPTRSLNNDGEPFETYADAVGALDRPAGARLDLTTGRYFDVMGAAEALAHEFATATRKHGQVTNLGALPLRSAIGDPCDLSRRPVSERGHHSPDLAQCVTRRRDILGALARSREGHACGWHVPDDACRDLPARHDNPASLRHDLNLSYSMVREFSEELLGSAENYIRFGTRSNMSSGISTVA